MQQLEVLYGVSHGWKRVLTLSCCETFFRVSFLLVNEANVWIHASRMNTRNVYPDHTEDFFIRVPTEPFLAAARLHAVAATHTAVRKSELLQRCAPLSDAESDALVLPADEVATREFYELDVGLASFVDGTGIFSSTERVNSWVGALVGRAPRMHRWAAALRPCLPVRFRSDELRKVGRGGHSFG